MKCPFCAEEIKDEAIVCRYCGRDLIKPKTSTETPFYKCLWAVLFPLLFLIISRLGYETSVHKDTWNTFILISLFSPLMFGIWLGLRLPGIRLKAYIIVGVIYGFLGLGSIVVMKGGSILKRLREANWLIDPVSLIWFGGAILMYTSGGLIGNWIERKRSGVKATKDFAEKLAKKLVGSGEKPLSGEKEISINARVENLAKIIQALAPILTFIASLITAYLTYRAATKK